MILLGERFNVDGGGRVRRYWCVEGTHVIVTPRDISAAEVVGLDKVT